MEGVTKKDKIQEYQSIDCNFYDILLDRATRKVTVTIVYTDADAKKTLHAVIQDVYSSQGAEFLNAGDEQIRLDHLISVDGMALASFDACKIR